MNRIFLADDHQIVKDGLKLIIQNTPQFTVVGEASDGDSLIKDAFNAMPDVIVSDLKMPGTSIIEGCLLLKEKLPDVKVIVLTAYDESEDIYRAIDAGIDGYIMKDTAPDEIISTIQMVLLGYSCYQPDLTRKRGVGSHQVEDKVFSLTEREREVFDLIIDNLSNAEIAKRLFISEPTVKTHVSSILRKTGQPNRSQAVLFALKNGYLQPN